MESRILRLYSKKREHLINELLNCGYKVKHFKARCEWRLVVGLGSIHPQETSMILHHIYDIPYAPGSAIKGITRHWAVLKFAEKYYKENKEDIRDFKEVINNVSSALEKGLELEIKVDGIKFKNLIEIFGSKKQVGKVIFLDAYPVGEINLVIDIINVHYPEYYLENKPPADWQSPRLVEFLTVENTVFMFAIVGKKDNNSEALLNKASFLLKEALSEHGIGAKTSLGYGIFNINEEV